MKLKLVMYPFSSLFNLCQLRISSLTQVELAEFFDAMIMRYSDSFKPVIIYSVKLPANGIFLSSRKIFTSGCQLL
jgi:hypothetical protein